MEKLQLTPHQLANLRKTAATLYLPLEKLLQLVEMGLRYCRACKQWLPGNLFYSGSNSKVQASGTCKLCQTSPKGQELGRSYGSFVVAASKLNIPLEEYLKHRQAGEQFCSRCRAWRLSTEEQPTRCPICKPPKKW